MGIHGGFNIAHEKNLTLSIIETTIGALILLYLTIVTPNVTKK